MSFLKQLFCSHDYECLSSHFECDKPYKNIDEGVKHYQVTVYKCNKCGKMKAIKTKD